MIFQKPAVYLHPQLCKTVEVFHNIFGPFVYRLGRKIFILERAVRFCYGLPYYNTLISQKTMANNNSAIKRIRQANKKRLHNRYYIKSTRTAIKRLRTTTDKEKATELLPQVSSMLDKLAKRNMIHKNKANNLKSKLAIHVNKLA